MADRDIEQAVDVSVVVGPEPEPLTHRLSRLCSPGNVKALDATLSGTTEVTIEAQR